MRIEDDEIKLGKYVTSDGKKFNLIRITGNQIIIERDGKKYSGPKNSIGTTIFPIETYEGISEDIETLIPKIQGSEANWINEALEVNPTITCKECKLYTNEECVGEKAICEYFQPSYNISPYEQSLWPKYGDATGFRLNTQKYRK